MSPSARNPGLDAEDARVEDAVIAAAIARGVITAGQAASARDTRDAASARGEASTLLGALASSLDPGRREQLRQLREVTVSQAPRTIAGDTTRLDPDAPPAAVPDATRWTDATAVAFGRGVPAELGGATRRFTDVLRPDAAGGDQTFLSWDGRGEPPPRGGDDAATIADPPRRGAPRPGTVLGGRFEVLSELGRGGMGAVFRAVDRQAGVEVALKLIMDELGSPERRERFLREGEIAAGFEHPGIVRVHAVGELDGRPFVACELVLGCRTLDQVLPGLGRSARIGLVRDAARALGHAHARGVAHRDVKPQNLLVDDRGRLKVADFGLALTADHDRLTRTGVQLGTPSFMAPEQVDAAREAQGPRTDVWALGVVLYEALCGRRPFQAPSFAQLCVAITRGAPPAPRSIDPTISPALDALVLSALQVDPALRPKDGEAVAQALDRALADRPSAADLPALRAPASDVERIGPYEVVRPIGEGGAGIVYEARAQDGRRVALKVLHPQAETEGSEQVDRFGRETSAASRLRHPGIAQVLDSGTDAKGRRFIALELVPGETLHARLKRERTLDEREAARLAAAIARALEHAHGQGVLHRDVKPHNVLLAPDGPKLVDFGLARSIGDSTLTAKGAMLGTPGYLPPEQAEKQASIDARADVYGVGATLYHMLTGRPPFIGDTLGQVLMAVLKKPAVRPSTLRPGLAPALDTIVLTCLEKERDDRYPGPAALADDLERFLRGEVVRPLARATGQRSATSDAAEPAPRAGTTDRRMLALASGVVVAALAGAAVIVWRTNEAAERQREVERLAQAKAESDAELERVRAEAARDHEAAERARADAEARDRARAGPGPPEQPRPDPARTDPTTPDPPRPDPPPEHRPRGRGESSGSLRFERDVSVLGLRPWLSRRLAAARIWGRGAPGWAFSVDDAQHEAGKRGVPLVVVMLAPDLTELPSLLRDPALLAEVNQRAAIVLLQHRDKHLHDEVVDGRALDCGNWPGRDDQVCPIARTAPCEIHDRCEEQWERGGGLPLRPGERWRVLVLDPRSTGCADFGEGEPPPTSLPPRSPTTADALRDALRCAEGDAGPGVRLDALCDAQVALSAAALPETAAPDVTALGRSADAFAPHLGEALLAGAFSRWAEVELERVVSGGRKLLAATPAAGRAQVESDLRAALAAHPSVIERILAP